MILNKLKNKSKASLVDEDVANLGPKIQFCE